MTLFHSSLSNPPSPLARTTHRLSDPLYASAPSTRLILSLERKKEEISTRASPLFQSISRVCCKDYALCKLHLQPCTHQPNVLSPLSTLITNKRLPCQAHHRDRLFVLLLCTLRTTISFMPKQQTNQLPILSNRPSTREMNIHSYWLTTILAHTKRRLSAAQPPLRLTHQAHPLQIVNLSRLGRPGITHLIPISPSPLTLISADC
jgi:hypothetical protein